MHRDWTMRHHWIVSAEIDGLFFDNIFVRGCTGENVPLERGKSQRIFRRGFLHIDVRLS
jgi:hypothetical protein